MTDGETGTEHLSQRSQEWSSSLAEHPHPTPHSPPLKNRMGQAESLLGHFSYYTGLPLGTQNCANSPLEGPAHQFPQGEPSGPSCLHRGVPSSPVLPPAGSAEEPWAIQPLGASPRLLRKRGPKCLTSRAITELKVSQPYKVPGMGPGTPMMPRDVSSLAIILPWFRSTHRWCLLSTRLFMWWEDTEMKGQQL